MVRPRRKSYYDAIKGIKKCLRNEKALVAMVSRSPIEKRRPSQNSISVSSQQLVAAEQSGISQPAKERRQVPKRVNFSQPVQTQAATEVSLISSVRKCSVRLKRLNTTEIDVLSSLPNKAQRLQDRSDDEETYCSDSEFERHNATATPQPDLQEINFSDGDDVPLAQLQQLNISQSQPLDISQSQAFPTQGSFFPRANSSTGLRTPDRTSVSDEGIHDMDKVVRHFPASSRITYSDTIQSTEFVVNAFHHKQTRNKRFFISRFRQSIESECVRGLNEYFHSHLYATPLTARLVNVYLHVDKCHLHELHPGKPHVVDNVQVTAVEVPNYPGAALFLFKLITGKCILHAGDLRCSADLEEDVFLLNNDIQQIYFDPSMLLRLTYQFPSDTDRYIDLMKWCADYLEQNKRTGLRIMIALGMFDLGMEELALRIARHLDLFVWMHEERLKFYRKMIDHNNNYRDTLVGQLMRRVDENPAKASIHLMNVDDINVSYLQAYMNRPEHGTFHRVLAIRPRGLGDGVRVFDEHYPTTCVDIPNPLIASVSEYDRFVKFVLND